MVIYKIVDKITKVSRTLPQNRSDTVESGAGSMAFDREIAWEKSEKTPMEYQKKNLLDNTPDQQSKFRTKNWVETKNDSRGMYNTNMCIKLRASILKSNLCNYSDAYILVKGTISVVNVVFNQVADANKNDKEVVFKNSAPLTDWISEINNTQTDNAKALN